MGNFIFCAVCGIPIRYIDVKSKNVAKNTFQVNNEDNRKPFDTPLLFWRIISNFKYHQISTFKGKFHFKYVSHLVLVFLFPTFKL